MNSSSSNAATTTSASSRSLTLTATDEQQVRKRARTHAHMSLDHEIALLNESGVSNMAKGQIDDAQQFFVKALDAFKAKQQGIELPLSEMMLMKEDSQRGMDGTDAGGDAEAKEGATSANADTATATCLDEMQEYDEGVYAYRESMTLGRNVSGSLQSATLYYNVALTFVSLRKFYEAACWFKLAVICINLLPTSPSTATTLVRIYHNLGYCCYHLRETSDALHCFEKALTHAKELGNKKYAASARNAVAVLLYHSATATNKKLALDMLRESLAEYRSCLGDSSKEAATVLNNLGRVCYADGDFQEALAAYTKALEVRRDVLKSDSVDVAATICSMGQTQHRLGDLSKAIEYYKEFLALAEQSRYNNRDIAIITKNLAEIFHKQGKLAEAKPLYEKALVVGRLGFGEIHPDVASSLNRLGNWHYESKDMEMALECYTEGLEIEQLTLPACHPRIVVTLKNIAQIHYNFGDYAKALLRYKRIYSLQREAHGPTSLEAANAMSTMAEMEYKMKNYESAFDSFQEVLVIQRVNFGDSAETLEIASTLNSIGIVAFAQGDFNVAKSCFIGSLDIRMKKLGPNHKDTATLWYNLATTYEEIGDDDNAVAMYKETLRIERLSPGGEKSDVVDTLQRLGRLCQSRGDLDGALNTFRQALDALKARGDKRSFSTGKILNLIGNIHLQRANIDDMMECYTEASYIYRECSTPSNEVLVISGYYLYGLAKMHPACAAVA